MSHFHSAEQFCVVLASCQLWHIFCLRYSRRKSTINNTWVFSTWAQYYTPMYIGIMYYSAAYLYSSLSVMMKTGFLMHSLTNSSQLQRSLDNLTTKSNLSVKELEDFWKTNLDMTDCYWLRLLVLSAPLWLFGNLVISTYSTYGMVFRRKANRKASIRGIDDSPWNWLLQGVDKRRSQAILIVSLPLVYGLNACWALQNTWLAVANMQLSTIQIFGNTAIALQNTKRRCDSSMAVADLYEALVMYVFGLLLLDVAEEHSKKTYSRISRSGGCRRSVTDDVRQELMVLNQERRSLTTNGIRYFCIACALASAQKALPVYISAFSGQRAEVRWLNAVGTFRLATEKSYFEGMGMITSFVAIENLVTIEYWHGTALENQGFAAKIKFLSAKFLVSIIFVQDFVFSMSIFDIYSEMQRTMLRLAMLVFECFFLAVLHHYAWPSDERWYQPIREKDRRATFTPDMHRLSLAIGDASHLERLVEDEDDDEDEDSHCTDSGSDVPEVSFQVGREVGRVSRGNYSY